MSFLCRVFSVWLCGFLSWSIFACSDGDIRGNWFWNHPPEKLLFEPGLLRDIDNASRHVFYSSLSDSDSKTMAQRLIASSWDRLYREAPSLFGHFGFLGGIYTLGVISFSQYQHIRAGRQFTTKKTKKLLLRLQTLSNETQHLLRWVNDQQRERWRFELIYKKEGRVQNPFRLGKKLNESGFGKVYKAKFTYPLPAPLLKNLLVVKINEFDEGGFRLANDFLSRTELFASTLLQLNPGFLAPFGAARYFGHDISFMPFLHSSRELLDELKNHRIKVLLTWVLEAAKLVQAARDLGVNHYDIKLSNILLDSKGNVYLIDFGVASIQWISPDVYSRRSLSNMYISSMPYTSPEAINASFLEFTERSQVFSLGVILYHMVTKDSRLDSDHYPNHYSVEIISDDMTKAITDTPLAGSLHQVHPGLLELFLASTRRVDKRIHTVKDFIQRLEKIIAGISDDL